MSRHVDFTVEDDCEKAISEASRLKAFKIRNSDMEVDFSDLWWHIQHEWDMFDEGHDDVSLTKSSSLSARRWLDKYEHLFTKYDSLKKEPK